MPEMLLVKLTYFKRRGKYYAEGSFPTRLDNLWEIWEQVAQLREEGRLPGLVDGAREFHVLVDVPAHEHNHPHLVTL